MSETKITYISVDEGPDEKDCNLVISTKNNQIIYLNLYKEIYFPDHQQIQIELNTNEDVASNNDDDASMSILSSEDDASSSRRKHRSNKKKIKSVGIEEEDILEQQEELKKLEKEN